MKTAKFLIAENPIVDDGRVFIIHTRSPVIIAEAFHFELDQEAEWMKCKSHFELGATVDYPGELIVLGARFMGPPPYVWSSYTDQELADRLAKIMRRMADWYYSYLEWEDNIENLDE